MQTGHFPSRNATLSPLVKINIFGKNSHSSYTSKNYICLMDSAIYKGKKLPGVLHYSFLSFSVHVLHEEVGMRSPWWKHAMWLLPAELVAAYQCDWEGSPSPFPERSRSVLPLLLLRTTITMCTGQKLSSC